MTIVEGIERGELEGVSGVHDHVIETVLSKLFVRGDEVWKAYKHRTADFADLANHDVRREYIREDFFWNNAMSPDVYRELRSVRRLGDEFVHAPEGEAHDWYIVMKRIDTTRDLTSKLRAGALSRGELHAYVATLLPRLRELTSVKRHGLETFFKRGVMHVRDEVLNTTGWARTGEPFLALGDVYRAEELMRHALDTESYFASHPETLSVVIDVNGENILFLDNDVAFIDVMPPKDAWRVHDAYFIVSRTSADVSALMGGEHADAIHDAFAATHQLPSAVVRAVYEIASALIQVPYRKMVDQPDLAGRYADFVRRRSRELEQLLASR